MNLKNIVKVAHYYDTKYNFNIFASDDELPEDEESQSTNNLINTVDLKKIKRGNYGDFPVINLDPFFVSIQGGRAYYSDPKEDLESLDDYTELEVAILLKDNSYFNPYESKFKSKSWARNFENVNVASHMPKEMIVDMLKDLIQYAS